MNVIVFNLTQPEEEKSAIDQWLQSIQAQAPDAPTILIGTHSDDKKCTQEYDSLQCWFRVADTKIA